MKHPQREEWIPFVLGEANPQDRRRLAAHLEQCPDCTREIESWRRSLRKLDSWPLPKLQPSRAQFFAPAIKWALAAALVLGVGFLVGRTTGRPDFNSAPWRTELDASVRSALQAEMNLALHQFQEETSNSIHQSEARLARTSAMATELVRNEVGQLLEAAHREESRNLQQVLQKLQQQHEADLIALRKDLETLASTTDEEIRRARVRLTQLAAFQQTE